MKRILSKNNLTMNRFSELRSRTTYGKNITSPETESDTIETSDNHSTMGTGYYLVLLLVLVPFFALTTVLFNYVYDASKTVVDELYHVPQGLAYCQNNFSYWDPKITTLPGLYVISASLVSACCECNLYNLRFVNVFATLINLCLFSSIFKFIYGVRGNGFVTAVLQGLNLCILPPLYFFSHVYYTDILSLTFILALFRLSLTGKHKMAILVVGALSVAMRQTNVVWIGMILGHRALDIFVRSSRVYGVNSDDQSKVKRYYDVFDLYAALRYHVRNCFVTYVKSITTHDWKVFATHGAVLGAFAIFVVANGSIVVGDKTAHVASLHIPQLLYFLLFYGFFALPFVAISLRRTILLMSKNKPLILGLSAVFLVIVAYNTIVHPYLLADNRHYTFYIWNRWFNKYWFAKYATIPAYVFLFFNLYANLKDQNCVSFLLPYSVCTFAVLALQSMIEVRYFLIPYIILRMRFPRVSLTLIILEFVWYVAINAVAFQVFFSKEFMWKDFEDSQRIIW